MPNKDLQIALARFNKITTLVAELIENYAVFINDHKTLLDAVNKTIGNAGEALTAEKIQHLERLIQTSLAPTDQDAKTAITNIFMELCKLAELMPPKADHASHHRPAPLLLSAFTRNKAGKSGTTSAHSNEPTPGKPNM